MSRLTPSLAAITLHWMSFMVALGFMTTKSFAAPDLAPLTAQMASATAVVVGGTHSNPIHAQTFIKLLKQFEGRYPNQLSMVGLEVFQDFQSRIDDYMKTGDETYLAGTADDEILRGHTGDAKNFLQLYRALYQISKQRSEAEKIQVLALDQRPAPAITLNEWSRTHSPIELFNWAFTRDSFMFSALSGMLRQSALEKKTALIFIGSAHAQRSGGLDLTLGTQSIKMVPLGAQIAQAHPNTLTVNQNAMSPVCMDRIEKTLSKIHKSSPQIYDLRTHAYGQMSAFECDNAGLPAPPIKATFTPVSYVARDHFDFYIYFPAQP